MPSEPPRAILVVDDQADERAIQSAMLGHLGYRVREAADGPSGIAAALDDPPDLILLDIAMPRMDGFAVSRALRSDPRAADVRILFFTASVVTDLEEQARNAGADGVLVKPVEPRSVAVAVRNLIGPPVG